MQAAWGGRGVLSYGGDVVEGNRKDSDRILFIIWGFNRRGRGEGMRERYNEDQVGIIGQVTQ